MILSFDIEDKHLDSTKSAHEKIISLVEMKAPSNEIKKAEKTYFASLKVIMANIEEQLEEKVVGEE